MPFLQGQGDLPQLNCHSHEDRGQSVALRREGDRVEVTPVVGVNDCGAKEVTLAYQPKYTIRPCSRSRDLSDRMRNFSLKSRRKLARSVA
jgi:hypothetical protein